MGDESEREPIDVLEVFEASSALPCHKHGQDFLMLSWPEQAGSWHLWRRAL